MLSVLALSVLVVKQLAQARFWFANAAPTFTRAKMLVAEKMTPCLL
jgi:hypothetical protein